MSDLAIHGGKPIREKAYPDWPVWGDEEKKLLTEVLDSGKWGYPNWKYVPEFEENFASYHDAKYGICYSSGTTGLMGALWAVGVKPGDEVIIPAYTFIATASALMLMGATPVFADIEENSFHLDPDVIEASMTSRTKAVMTVHIGGRASNMRGLKEVCEKNGLKLIEDAAQAWGAEWEHNRVGAMGDAGVFSFQSSKNLTSAEGGIILTNDEEVAKYCRSFADCGRVAGRPKYEHYYIGSNFRITDFQGAILMAQFGRYPELHAKRRANAAYLTEAFKDIPGITAMNEDDFATISGYHFYLMRYDLDHFEGVPKSKVVEALQKEGLPAHPGYTLPLYKQPVFLDCAFGPGGSHEPTGVDYGNIYLPETESACSDEGIWIPQKALLGDESDMNDIVKGFKKIQKFAKDLKEK